MAHHVQGLSILNPSLDNTVHFYYTVFNTYIQYEYKSKKHIDPFHGAWKGAVTSRSWKCERPVESLQSVRYADASGDFNPLHTDLQLAK